MKEKSADHPVTRDLIGKAVSYEEFRLLTDRLLLNNKTTGSNHIEAMLNLLPELLELLNQIDRKMYWLVLVEAWCGDVAQNLPVIARMVGATEQIQLLHLLRDEHLEIIDAFLTNGGRAIPKLIALDADTLEILFTWGPRPQEVQDLTMTLKSEGMAYAEAAVVVHGWYAKNKTVSLQNEFTVLLEQMLEDA
ncbi:MAG: thioredoxin family protein [Rhodothermaceae bacterium]|nr:thioredoxin family protein [Rhodothermaceae bacterium]